MFLLPNGSDVRLCRLEACLCADVQQRGIPATCWQDAPQAPAPDDCAPENADTSVLPAQQGTCAGDISAACRQAIHLAAAALATTSLENASHQHGTAVQYDKLVAAQHASASAVFDGVSTSRVRAPHGGWLACLTNARDEWPCFLQQVLAHGLYNV